MQVSEFYHHLRENGIGFYSGVPDSLLKNFCAYINDNVPNDRHIIAANEGGGIALATGFHLATGKIPLVYMQNSGLGNTINPLLSLADKEVYGIPMLLLIGWRGEPGLKDEPQHIKQGRVQNSILNSIEIPYVVIDGETENVGKIIKKMVKTALNDHTPVAMVVKKNTFETYSSKSSLSSRYEMKREEVVEEIVRSLTNRDIIVSTTGKTSRELFEVRERLSQDHQNDFLTVGSMGHANQIACGIALQKPKSKVICIDGDGALLMHMGSMAIIGSRQPGNYIHVLINNGVHESVGGQPTVAFAVDIPSIAKACGYKHIISIVKIEELRTFLKDFKKLEGPLFVEIKTAPGSRHDLGRPTTTPVGNKLALMDKLSKK